MATLHELAEMPLHEVTLRVQTAETPEEKMHTFGDWILRVIGIDGVHDLDSINEVLHSEFGDEVTMSGPQLINIRRGYGHVYRVNKRDDTYRWAA